MWDDLTDEQRNELVDAVAECCGDMYWCQRVWSAWSYGTMSQNDFVPADNCEDFLVDVAKSVFDRASKIGAVDNSTQHSNGAEPAEICPKCQGELIVSEWKCVGCGEFVGNP